MTESNSNKGLATPLHNDQTASVPHCSVLMMDVDTCSTNKQHTPVQCRTLQDTILAPVHRHLVTAGTSCKHQMQIAHDQMIRRMKHPHIMLLNVAVVASDPHTYYTRAMGTCSSMQFLWCRYHLLIASRMGLAHSHLPGHLRWLEGLLGEQHALLGRLLLLLLRVQGQHADLRCLM